MVQRSCLWVLWLGLSYALAEMTEEPSMSWEEVPEEILNLRSGQELELKCGASGSPPPTIHWYKSGLRLSQNPLTMDEESIGSEVEQVANQGLPTIQMGTTYAKLRISCLEPADSGDYACVATNGLLPALVKNISLTVAPGKTAALCPKMRRSPSVPANIMMWTDMRLERSDAVAQLFCRAAGVPRPAIQWFHLDPETMEKTGPVEHSEKFILLRNGDLLVRGPEPKDQGGFNFLCEASNPSGIDSQTITLVDVAMEGEGDPQE